MTCILIDDIYLARVSLRADIEEYCPELNIIGEADSVITAAKAIKTLRPDLLFLDIEMGDGNGFDLLDIITDNQCHIIFVTGSKEFAIRAFQYAASDYLLKPIDPILLVKAVQKIKTVNVLREKGESKIVRLVLPTSEEMRVASSQDIVRCEAEGNYTIFYFEDKSKIITSKTLKEYDEKLVPADFLRVHQSHLVNIKYIKSFIKTEGGYLLMKDGSHVPVSVRKKQDVMQMIGTIQ